MILVVVLAGCTKPQAQNSAPADSVPAPAAAPASASTPPVVIPQGTPFEARVNETLSTARNHEGDRFTAALERPVDIGGREVLPRGSRIQGHVTTSRSSGRMEGRAVIGIKLDAVDYNGHSIPMETTLDTKTGEAHKKRNLELIGGGSAFGAVVGALAGGGKGAAIGAMAGGAAGAGGAAATGKENVEIPAETVFTFRLKAPMQLP